MWLNPKMYKDITDISSHLSLNRNVIYFNSWLFETQIFKQIIRHDESEVLFNNIFNITKTKQILKRNK